MSLRGLNIDIRVLLMIVFQIIVLFFRIEYWPISNFSSLFTTPAPKQMNLIHIKGSLNGTEKVLLNRIWLRSFNNFYQSKKDLPSTDRHQIIQAQLKQILAFHYDMSELEFVDMVEFTIVMDGAVGEVSIEKQVRRIFP